MYTRACAAAHAAHAARADEGWSGLRVSYGLCGIVIMDRDVLAVADYLWRHQARPARQTAAAGPRFRVHGRRRQQQQQRRRRRGCKWRVALYGPDTLLT